jgi:hypothetical protein
LAIEDGVVMKKHHHKPPFQDFTTEIQKKQSNILWPDALLNSKHADALILKGSRSLSVVQRIGITIWGLAITLLGLIFLAIAFQIGSRAEGVLGCLIAALGVRVLFNGLRPNRKEVECAPPVKHRN